MPGNRIRFALRLGAFLLTSTVSLAYAACAGITDRQSAVCTGSEVSLQALIARTNADACKQTSPNTLMCSRRLEVRELANTTVVGDDLKIIFADPRPGKGGLVFRGAENISISNFSITWAGLTDDNGSVAGAGSIFSYGMVEQCENVQSARILTDPPNKDLPSIEAISIWSDQSGWPWQRGLSGGPVERYFLGKRALPVSAGTTTCNTELSAFAGQRVLLRHYVYANNAITCRDCTRVLVKDVVVRSAPGMAFLFWGGSDIALIRNRVAPACAPSCAKAQPSAASDASHFGGVSGTIVVSGNDFSMQGDDSVNITSWVYPGIPQKGAESGRLLVQIDRRLEHRFWALTAGQSVKIADLGLKELGVGKVLDVNMESMTVRLESSLTKLPEAVVLIPLNRVPGDVIIENNHFHDHRARGVLVQAGRVTITGNVIERVTMAAIMIGGDTDYWFEGPGVESAVIKGNKIRQVNAYPYSKDYPSAISAAFVPDRKYRETIGHPIGPITIEANQLSEIYSSPGKPVSFGAGLCCNRE